MFGRLFALCLIFLLLNPLITFLPVFVFPNSFFSFEPAEAVVDGKLANPMTNSEIDKLLEEYNKNWVNELYFVRDEHFNKGGAKLISDSVKKSSRN